MLIFFALMLYAAIYAISRHLLFIYYAIFAMPCRHSLIATCACFMLY